MTLVGLRSRWLHVEGVAPADGGIGRDVAQDRADATRGAHRDGLAAVEAAVVPVELGQCEDLAGVLLGGLLGLIEADAQGLRHIWVGIELVERHAAGRVEDLLADDLGASEWRVLLGGHTRVGGAQGDELEVGDALGVGGLLQARGLLIAELGAESKIGTSCTFRG